MNTSKLTTGPAALEFRGIGKSFGALTVLNGASLRLSPAEAILLTGANGSGKTTLLNVLSGFLRPDCGEVWVRGRPAPLGAPHRVAQRGLRRTFQDTRVFPMLTVIDNVLVGGEGAPATLWSGVFRGSAYHQGEARLLAAARQALGFVHLSDREEELAGGLSLGQQKLLEIARMLVASPAVLLLDEPLAGVHYKLAAEILEVLSRLRQSGHALLIVEHESDLVAPLVDGVACLAEGRISLARQERAVCA